MFSIAIAMQNIVWGLTQPFSGMLADRFGVGKIVLAGALLYAAGLWLMSASGSPGELYFSAGLLIGLGLLVWMVVRAWRGGVLGDAYVPVEMSGLYWHFIDIVWIYLFPLLYLLDRQ